MNEPKTIRAGTTSTWSESHADYPASEGWALTYYLRGASSLDIEGVADGDAFDLTITAAQSALLTAGIYKLQGRFSKDAEKHSPDGYLTELEILADISAQAAGYDPRSESRIALDLVRASIRKYAANPITSLQINNRSHTITTLQDLYNLQKKLEADIRAEDDKERIQKGLHARNRIIRGQFVKP